LSGADITAVLCSGAAARHATSPASGVALLSA
jgi:hypothetical protein